MTFRHVIVLVFSILASSTVLARGSLKATVVTDGAMVFNQPSFEGDVITYLQTGQRVRVTKKVKNGFRKVKVKAGLIGFIRVEDVRAEGEEAPVTKPPKRDEQDPYQDAADESEDQENTPFVLRRYAGPLLGILNYSESVAGQTPQANLTAFGMKLTGPDILLEGPLVDMNILLVNGAPRYYSQLTQRPASGFLFIADYRFLVPLSERQDRFMYFLAGPVVAFSSFNVELGGTSLSMQELGLGLTFGGGLAMRFGRFAARLEVNSHIEANRYFSLISGVQFEF